MAVLSFAVPPIQPINGRVVFFAECAKKSPPLTIDRLDFYRDISLLKTGNRIRANA